MLLIAASFPATTTGGIAVLQMIVGLFLHANVRWRLRPLHRIIATPDFHHWHHANEPASIHTNYAAFLPLWTISSAPTECRRTISRCATGSTNPTPRASSGSSPHH